MNGADYIALETIYTKTGEVRVKAGDRCGVLPASSIEWLSKNEPPYIKLASEIDAAEDAADLAAAQAALAEPDSRPFADVVRDLDLRDDDNPF